MSLLNNTAIYTLAQRVSTMDEGIIFEIVFNNPLIKNEIIRLNTREQLFSKGIDSDGVSLGTYAPFTVREKERKGQPTNRITLEDTGEFYQSFRVSANRVSITIDANPIKDDNNLFDDFGEDILGLTDDSKEKLKEMAVIQYIKYWKTNILR